MVISKLIDNNIAYYCLHAETAYSHSDTEDTVYNRSKDVVHISIYTTLLTKTAIDLVSEDIMNDTYCSTFVLDFDGIEKIQPNVIEEAISDLSNEHHKNVVLANVKESIITQQSRSFVYLVEKNKDYLIDKDAKLYSYFSIRETDCNQLSNYEKVFNQVVKDKLKKYTRTEKKEHHSSSVYLSAYIDIKQFITLDKPFILNCIYRLAKKIWIKWINNKQNDSFEFMDKPILVCQSLNGSFIASVLSSLLNLDLFIIDSIGPINKLYRSLGATIKSGKKYIVVSDVVCLGTEVKITKNIIEYLGGVYYGNVSIVRIESIKPYDNVESVFCINKKNMNEFNYRIITPLDDTFLDKTQIKQ